MVNPANTEAAPENAPRIVATRATGIRYQGVRAMAREIGCSPAHLSFVLHGDRMASPKLAAALRERGVSVPSLTTTKEETK